MKRCLILIAVLVSSAVFATEQPPRQVAPATITMQFPEAFGEMQRPAVEFDHKAHTKALEAEGCETCHRIDDKGVLIPLLKWGLEIDNRDDLIDAFHDSCMGCHRERSDETLPAGPLTCGECHVRRQPGVSVRAAMAFDYSLHARHAKAFDDKCENCHHVYDEVTEELKYEKGKEEGCRSCHGAVDEKRKLLLANASHRACISCHLRRLRSEQESGPRLCVGCHDLEQRNAIKRLEEVPRLMRGQPDTLWVHGIDAERQLALFGQSRSPAQPHRQLAHCLLGDAEASGYLTIRDTGALRCRDGRA
jgi:hypothetical protein